MYVLSEKNLHEFIRQNKPSLPTYLFDKSVLSEAVTIFQNAFPGKTVYAVKCNPSEKVIKTIYNNGVRAFDVASIGEIKLVNSICPNAELYFMHTIKSREAIAKAYYKYGIHRFAFDCEAELSKIMHETGSPKDLELFLRINLNKPSQKVQIDLSGKFGASIKEAITLLRKARGYAAKLGITFHVGSQCMDPKAFKTAIHEVSKIVKEANVSIDVIDIGGGFPVYYEDMTPPDINKYIATITETLNETGFDHLELLGEPGRALVADCMSLIVRVDIRKNNVLYINDGTYGGLFDAGPVLNTRFPVHSVKFDINNDNGSKKLSPFKLAGPTCDTIDMMEGPFYLPKDMQEEDWIIIERVGAYSISMRTNFNHFQDYDLVEIELNDIKNKNLHLKILS